MRFKNTNSMWLKTLACLACAFALVLSPPCASHAASGMHDDHHAAPASSDHSDTNHVQGSDSSNCLREKHASVSDIEGKDQTSGQCFSDICISAVLDDIGHDLVIQVAGCKYLLLHAQAASVEPSGLLRPPQTLI